MLVSDLVIEKTVEVYQLPYVIYYRLCILLHVKISLLLKDFINKPKSVRLAGVFRKHIRLFRNKGIESTKVN